MKNLYIGRIKLSKEDSEEWYGKPPFMYITKNQDRAKINDAILFTNKEKCRKELKRQFEEYGHLPESKMQIMEMSLTINNIEDV